MRFPWSSSPWQRTIIGAGLTFILLSPLIWVLRGSFLTDRELFSPKFTLLPETIAWQNWPDALVRLGPHLATSLIVGSVTALLTLALAAPAAYGIVWLRLRGKRSLFAMMLAAQMLPAIVFVIPLFILFTRLDLVNSLQGLILADMTFTTPFAIIMFCAYLRDFPYELVEAALVDGASHFRVFRSIVLPISLPGLVTVGIFSFLIPWGDLIFSLTLITETNIQPLTLELYKAVGQYGIQWSFLLPGSVLTAIPAIIFVMFASRYIVSGVTRGAIR
jgi:multiple sugar transport system permease protein